MLFPVVVLWLALVSASLSAQELHVPRDTPRQTVVISAPAEYAGGQVADDARVGLLGNLEPMNTPFSTTAYTSRFIRDQQAGSLADLVQSDGGVRVARGFGNFQELYFVRGFPVYSDDISYNGLYGILPRQYVAAEWLERVDVFRGANTLLNGAAPGGSGIGGAFNLVPKRAVEMDLNRATLGYDNSSLVQGALDVSRRWGTDRQAGARLNVARRGGDASIDNEHDSVTVSALAMDMEKGSALLSFDAGWQDRRVDSPRPNVTPTGEAPVPPPASSNFAQPWTFTAERDLFGVARAELHADETTSGWLAVGARRGTESNRLANATSDAFGDTTMFRFDNYRRDLVTSAQMGFRTAIHAGRALHEIAVSLDLYDLDSKNAFASSPRPGFAGSLYDPQIVNPPETTTTNGGDLSAPLTTNRVATRSGAIADTLSSASGRWLLVGGLRWQSIGQRTYDASSGNETSAYEKSAVTPAIAVLVKLRPNVSVYANYIEGLIRGDVAPATAGAVVISNVGQAFEPFRSRQYEAGVKYGGGSFGATLAAFSITRPSARIVGTAYRNDGEQRNDGIEITWFGQPWKTVRVLGGATALRAENTRTPGSLNDGRRVIGVPRLQANAGAEWDVDPVRGMTLEGRVVFTGSEPVNAANTSELPSWTRFDLGARYIVSWAGQPLAFRANVMNVANRRYWSSVGGVPGANYLVLAAPLTVAISASLDF